MDQPKGVNLDPEPQAEAEAQDNNTQKIDTGLSCLVMIARYHGVAADPAQLKHAFAIGNEGMTTTDIVRAAKELGFKAKTATVDYERLQKIPLPAIVEFKDSESMSLT